MEIGETFNESSTFNDPVTAKFTRRLTCTGLYNQTPTYHLNAAFSADSRHIVLASAREGGSAILRADVESGDLTVLAMTDGIGDYSSFYATGGDTTPFVPGSTNGGFTGNHLALGQAGEWVIACPGRSLRVYHLRTLKERVLIADVGKPYRFGNPIGSIDGTKVIVTRVPIHPELVNSPNTRRTRDYMTACNETWGGMPTVYLQVDINTGEVVEMFEEKIAGSHHVQPCPIDPDFWLIDRDFPPRYWGGSDHGKTTRAWLLNVKTKALTELAPADDKKFQIHTNWNHTGQRVYYHGPSAQGGQYIGVADLTGQRVWEKHFDVIYYGHVSTHTQAEAIVTDGLVTPDMVTAIYYEELDSSGAPRIELLARHGTQWDGIQAQFTHPHCHMSPDGRWLSYNKGERGRSDVYLVRVK